MAGDFTTVDGNFMSHVAQFVDSAFVGVEPPPGSPHPGIAFSLSPRPSRGNVTVNFTCEHDTDLQIRVLDAAGREVTTLTHGRFTAGRHVAVWSANPRLNAGLFFIQLRSARFSLTQKCVVLR